MCEITLQILKYSYWEHFKKAKELALILPIKNIERKKIEQEINKIQLQIQQINNIQ